MSENVLKETNLNNGVQVVSTHQICLRLAHTTMKSYQRFNRAFQQDELP